MRHLLTLTCFLLVTAAVADDAEFDFESKKAKAAIQKYKDEMRKAKKRNGNTLLRSLQSALKHERTDGDLDEALKIQGVIKELKKDNKSTPLIKSNSMQMNVGVWMDKKLSPTPVLVIRPDGTAYNSHFGEGKWRMANQSSSDFDVYYQSGRDEHYRLSPDKKNISGSDVSSQNWIMARDSYPEK